MPQITVTKEAQNLIGKKIQYKHGYPYMCSPLIAIGEITDAYADSDGTIMLHVQPDKPNLCPKWKTITEVIKWLPAESKATAV